MPRKAMRHFAPSHIILFSAVSIILIGALLLMLPFAHTQPTSFLDILFTSTSAATGTGLLTVPLSHFTPFGITIIMMIAQVGALGLILMTVTFLYLFLNINFGKEVLTTPMIDVKKPSQLKRILFFILSFTFAIEIIGGLFIAFGFSQDFNWLQSLLYGLFFAVSAFTSMGISIFPGSLDHYSHNGLVLIPIIILMIAGAIGFITLREFIKHFTQKEIHHFSLGSKIAWTTTAILLILAIGVFWGLEHDYSLASYNPLQTVMNSIFNGVSSMGIGFDTVNVNALRLPTLLMIMIIAFIGASPGSTGSGIRTTTVAIFFGAISTVIWGKPYVQMFDKRIPQNQVYKATAIIALSVPWVIFATFVMLILEPEYNFLQILFESMSAFSTLGLSTGITPYLSATSKSFLILNMFLGRIGPFTLIFAIQKAIKPKIAKTPEEPILLG